MLILCQFIAVHMETASFPTAIDSGSDGSGMDIISINKVKKKPVKLEPAPPTAAPGPAPIRDPEVTEIPPGDAGPVGMNGISSCEDSDVEIQQQKGLREQPSNQRDNDQKDADSRKSSSPNALVTQPDRPGTPTSPPLNPLSYAPQQRAVDMLPGRHKISANSLPSRSPVRRKARWDDCVETSNLYGVQYPRPNLRADVASHEPRGYDSRKRGGRQYNLDAPRDRCLVPSLPDASVMPTSRKFHPPPRLRCLVRKRKREDDSDFERKMRVIKKFQMSTSIKPRDALMNLRERNMGEKLPECCAAASSRLMRPYRIEGIKRFTTDDSDILECIFLPAVRRFATFLSLGFSLEVWESKLL